VAKAKQLDTQQNKENLLFLKEVLQFIRYISTRPLVLQNLHTALDSHR
jgi:hypothetical protein